MHVTITCRLEGEMYVIITCRLEGDKACGTDLCSS